MSVRIQIRVRNKYSFDEVGICCSCFPVIPHKHILPARFLFCLFKLPFYWTYSMRPGLVPASSEVLTILFWILLPPVASKSQLFFLLYSQLWLPTSYVLASTATHNGCRMCRVSIGLPCANSRREELPSIPYFSGFTYSNCNRWA